MRKKFFVRSWQAIPNNARTHGPVLSLWSGEPRQKTCAISASIDAVHGDAAKELGIKVRGFLRHHFAGGSDTHDLIDVNRIQQESDLRCSLIDRIKRGGSFSLV